MANISCDVIKDLLPLYVDNVLSPDSQKLVEKHLADCSNCQACHVELLHSSVRKLGIDDSQEGDAIRKIRKKINAKRLQAVCLTAALAALIAGALWYAIAWDERYVPFDSGAFIVNNDHLVVKPYYHCVGCLSPDEGTSFFYLTATTYDNWRRQRYDDWQRRQDIAAEFEPSLCEDDLPLVRPDPVRKSVYYVPADYAKRLQRGSYWLDGDTEADFTAKNQELLEELKAESILIEVSDDAVTNGTDNAE